MTIRFAAGLALGTLLLAGCATVYRGPSDYINYPYDGKAKSSTTAALVGTTPKLKSTYEDEFVYDAAGNLLKYRQTEYFNYDSAKPSYVVWETEFKVVGGVVLPYRQRVNDVVYVEIDYDTLVSSNKGAVSQGTSDRRFTLERSQGFSKVFRTWRPELQYYPVNFRADGKYVVTKNGFNYYDGFTEDNVLTPGFDNIVLKHFLYSHSKLVEGFNKSFQWGLFARGASNFNSFDTSFDYEWKAVANTIVQTKASYLQEGAGTKVQFIVSADYNDAGQRTGEVWTAQQGKDKPVVVFQQKLTY